jgi:hypothetical protein
VPCSSAPRRWRARQVSGAFPESGGVRLRFTYEIHACSYQEVEAALKRSSVTEICLCHACTWHGVLSGGGGGSWQRWWARGRKRRRRRRHALWCGSVTANAASSRSPGWWLMRLMEGGPTSSVGPPSILVPPHGSRSHHPFHINVPVIAAA